MCEDNEFNCVFIRELRVLIWWLLNLALMRWRVLALLWIQTSLFRPVLCALRFFVYHGSEGFLISIGAVYSLELWESGCLLSREGLTKERAGFIFYFFQSNQGEVDSGGLSALGCLLKLSNHMGRCLAKLGLRSLLFSLLFAFSCCSLKPLNNTTHTCSLSLFKVYL